MAIADQGLVYLLHFSERINPEHPCRHYLGYTTDLQERLEAHADGRGSRLCAVAKERGIGFALVNCWEGDRTLERQLKRRKNAPRYCPYCN